MIRLYTSPVKPPTKEQKKMTPTQWLELGMNRLSFAEPQKALTFTLEEEGEFNHSRNPVAGT